MGCSCSGIATPTVAQLPVQQTNSSLGGANSAPTPKNDATQNHAAHQATQGAIQVTAQNSASGDHDKHILARAGGDNRALSQTIMDAAMEFLAPLKFNETGGASNVDHRDVPESVKNAWRAKYPGIEPPRKVVFSSKDANAKVIGALFMSYNKPVDLGIGTQHKHGSSPMHMQHMWLIPSNLDQAFSDVTNKTAVIAAAKNAVGA